MVLVPPRRHTEATTLARLYNREGVYNLIFHCVPEPIDNEINEDKGRSAPNGPPRTLKALLSELEMCQAAVFLDDCNWKDKYPLTLKVVQDWTIGHTERPIISIHLDGRGDLIYNWCHLAALTRNDPEALHSRLLAQATKRGAQWYGQARDYRWVFLRLACVALVFSVSFSIVTIYLWHRGAAFEKQAERQGELLRRLTDVTDGDQNAAAKALAIFRADSHPDHWDSVQKLLKDNAYQIKAHIERISRPNGANNVSVSMFTVYMENSVVKIHEVAASREELKGQTYNFDTDLNQKEITNIVACSVIQGAFVLWSGDSSQGRTDKIEAWSLQGRPLRDYGNDPTRLDLGRQACRYLFPGVATPTTHASTPQEQDVLQKRLLCAPSGSTFNFHEPGNGAICVSVPDDGEFLSESWVRLLLIRFGNALSFSPWENSPRTNPKEARSQKGP